MIFGLPLVKKISQLFWRALSVGMFFKIMGIGALVAAIFGGVALLAVRDSTVHALIPMAQQRTQSVAQLLALNLAEPMFANNANRVEEILCQTMTMLPDIGYLIVREDDGRLVSHRSSEDSSGMGTIQDPPDIQAIPIDRQKRVEFNREKLVFEVVWPIVSGHGGKKQTAILQLGIQDRTIRPQLAKVTQSILWTLSLCAAIGFGLAFLLSYIITHPIHHLVQAVNRIGGGDFETRANVFSGDEIGRLALAFNEMSEGLQHFRQEVQEKEKARLALIKKIVYTQEKERKTISLELHDQLGQSLLALLLIVQSLGKEDQLSGDLLQGLEVQIREVLEEVRRLAWGMRPSVLDDYGLDRALSRLVEDIGNHSHLTIDYQFSGPAELGRLPAEMEVTLYRVAQEAIANIVRHAGATRASAIVLWHCSEVTLLVEDNGCGFKNESAARNSSSLGLIGMKERAALLGGSCAVESVVGQGTTIRVKIPLGKVDP